MKEAFSERLRNIMDSRQITQAALSRMTGITQSSISDWLRGLYEPKQDKVDIVARALHISPSFLMGWSDKQRAEADITKEFIPVSSRGVSIPVLGRVVAGRPIGAIEDVLGEIMIEPHLAKSGEFFALKVKGDSMTPDINHDDIVVVKKQEDIESGDIAVVLINAEDATVKKIKKLDNGIMLIGSNPSVFEPLYFSEQEIEEKPVTIVGKVVRAIRQF